MRNAPAFGQWLKQRRKTLDLTQDDLADRVGCAPATIRMIENGQRKPSRQVADLLARTLLIPDSERSQFLALARGSLPVDETSARSETTGEPPGVSSHNLPTLPTPLIGRDDDIETLTALLLRDDVRLLTLTGPPGIGKTSLAIESATRLLTTPHFKDGVSWVPLASTSDPEMVLATIARVLEAREVGAESFLDTLKQSLRGRLVLLLLDNFEQVIEAAPHVADLLAACPHLKVLVTSREALNLRGEREFNLTPLPLPEMLDGSLDALARNPAVALFVERAQAVDRHFSLTPENAPVVAAICARLDGLPLAIELVAARTRMLPLNVLLTRLQSTQGPGHLSLLSGGARDVPARHKTLRDAIGWSYSLLTNGEQLLFRRLGVFRGGFTLAAAEAICNARSDLGFDVFEGVAQLLNKNLLKRENIRDEDAEDGPRFTMLETIREYALDRLDALDASQPGEGDEIRLLHVEYFLALASAIDPTLVNEQQRQLLNRLDRDYDNLRATLSWTLATGRVNMAAQLGIKLASYWVYRTYYVEGRDWLTRILSAHAALSDEGLDACMTRARLLINAGALNTFTTDYLTARRQIEESLALSRETGLKRLALLTPVYLANVIRLQGDYDTAQFLCEECLAASWETDDRSVTAFALWELGTLLIDRGDVERAEDLLRQSAAISRERGDLYFTNGATRGLATALSYQGRYAEAIQLLEECLATADYGRFRNGVGEAAAAMAFALMHTGDNARAKEFYRESLALAKGGLDRHTIPDSLEGLARVELAFSQGDGPSETISRAATLLGAAEAARRLLKSFVVPIRMPDRESLIATVRSCLGNREYEQAHAVGQAMGLDEAISYALGLPNNGR